MAVYMYCSGCRTRTGLNHRNCNGCGRALNPKSHQKWVVEWHQNHQVYREHMYDVDLPYVKQVEYNRRVEAKHGVYQPTPRLAEAIELFLRTIQYNNPSSHRVMRTHCSKILDIVGNHAVNRIDSNMARKLKETLMDQHYSDSYVNDVISTARAVLAQTELDTNPFDQVKLNRVDNTRQRFLSSQEETRLLGQAREHYPHLYPMLVVALETGLRKSNLLNLRWSEIDQDNRTVTVKQKGGARHSVPLSDKCMAVLNQQPRNHLDWVFLNPKTSKPWRDINKAFKSCLELAHIETSFRWHDLRHTSASKLLRASGNIKLAQQFLGHKSINNTMRYAHLADDYLRQQINLM